MKFYSKIIKTSTDLAPLTALVVHSLGGCNLRCYGCFNKEELIDKEHVSSLTEDELIEKIKVNGFLVDALIFSGGEFLIDNISDITNFLNRVRSEFDGKIIIYTNGTYPEKVRVLMDLNLVDGFHVDMKLPFHSKSLQNKHYEKILGIKTAQRVSSNVLTTINMVIKENSSMSQIRTVRYPHLPENYFNEIKDYIARLNVRYGSSVEYKLNDFI